MEKKIGITPGKWRYEYNNHGNGSFSEWYDIVVNDDPDGDSIGKVFKKVDAKAIAALPKLIEAAVELINAWNSWTEIDRSRYGNQFDSAVGMAREAFKKAIG